MTRMSWLIAGLLVFISACVQAPVPTPTATTAITALPSSSGLVFHTLQDGDGASPLASDIVRVHYRGFFPDGREFDSSYERGEPTEFPLNHVIPCWTEGVQRMKVGGKARLECPPAIAYGARGTPGGPIPPNATLHFEIELRAIGAARR